MPAQNPAIFLQAGSHPAEDVRRFIAPLVANVAGVVTAGDMVVTQNGTPNMSVNVAEGAAFIPGSEATYQGVYFVENRGTTNLAVAASDPTNPRRDLVVARVQDAAYSGGTSAWSLAVITGTPAASPVDPAVPANCIVLARLQVAALATTVVNANITDLRPRTRSAWNQAWGRVASFTPANFTFTTTIGQSAIFTPTLVAGRRYLFSIYVEVLNGSATGTVDTVSLFDNTGAVSLGNIFVFTPAGSGNSYGTTTGLFLDSPGSGPRGYRVRAISSLAAPVQTVQGIKVDVLDVGPAA